MKRPLSTLTSSVALLGKVAACPVVFSWMFVTHFKPSLLKLWNPTPLKVLRVVRNDSCTLHGEHGCAMAFDAPVSSHDLSVPSPDYYRYGHDARPYLFSVNRPELLRFPSKRTLRQIARGFEVYGLKVKEVHVRVGSGLAQRTIIHPLV